MSFEIRDLQMAIESLKQFRRYSVSPHHERFSFPLLRGTYFTYRKIDVLRVVAIAKAVSNNPRYCDVGCGYGDFLIKIQEFIPDATGIERSADIFFGCNIPKPDYVTIADARWGINKNFDIIFVGWMEPGMDFRDAIAAKTGVIVTTLDQGISFAAEFDAQGFEQVASWRTPSWEDVNTEIMNRHYTKMSKETYQILSRLRGAHNLWYVYSKKRGNSEAIKSALVRCLEREKRTFVGRYDFEDVLDDCGFRYFEELEIFYASKHEKEHLWEIQFTSTC
jgi:SAM-dependent methyltransferase